jgi:hypothetical protein
MLPGASWAGGNFPPDIEIGMEVDREMICKDRVGAEWAGLGGGKG